MIAILTNQAVEAVAAAAATASVAQQPIDRAVGAWFLSTAPTATDTEAWPRCPCANNNNAMVANNYIGPSIAFGAS
jgi:hypothetical protein